MALRSSWIGLGISCLASGSLAQSATDWYPRPLFDAGSAVVGLVTHDFDGDGLLDVAVTNQAFPNGSVAVVSGRPDGTFGAPAQHTIGSYPTSLDAVDVNHDGKLDLVIACDGEYAHGTVEVLLASAPGRFAPALVSSAGGTAPTIALGDVDEDGELDAIIGDGPQPGSIGARWLRGRGDGSFDSAVLLGIPEWLTSPQLADLDGDGHLDLAAIVRLANAWTLRTWLGHGDGSFAPPVRTLLPRSSNRVRFADLDGDGLPEAVVLGSHHVAISFGGFVASLPSHGDGTFGRATTLWLGPPSSALALVDVDGDGRTDISVPHYIDPNGPLAGGVAWLRNLGGLAFAPAVEIRAGGSTLDAAWGDFEGDGDLDFVGLGDFTATELALVRATSPGAFEPGPQLLSAPGKPLDVALGDFDGDGWSDMVAPLEGSGVALWRGLGAGGFARQPTLPSGIEFERVRMLDVNHDGRDDIVAVGATWLSATNELWIWRTTPQGLGAPDIYSVGPGPHGLTFADFDSDGRADLAVASQSLAQVFHARADGTFEPLSSVVMGDGQYPMSALLAGDYDGDGHADLAQIPHEELLYVAYGHGDGGFDTPVATQLPEHIELITNGDLDLDGRDDLIIEDLDWHQGELSALFGRADRTFDVVPFTNLYGVNGVTIADFNGNGVPDVGAFDQSSLQVLTGDGARGFDAPRGFGIAQGSLGVAVADLDHDGNLDVVTALPSERRMAVLLHN